MTKLATTFGGTRVYIPATIGQDHPIACAIGAEASTKLAEYFATTSLSKAHRLTRRGQRVEIPFGPKNQPPLCDVGLSARAAALKHGVTERTIQRRRARIRDAGLL